MAPFCRPFTMAAVRYFDVAKVAEAFWSSSKSPK
jgi:hypothetical protein